jgi:hypothetical protein
VSSFYPGTAIDITEYNWGAENHINGATTQADIYGIFGRCQTRTSFRPSPPSGHPIAR